MITRILMQVTGNPVGLVQTAFPGREECMAAIGCGSLFMACMKNPVTPALGMKWRP
ncbi:hypothetical protein [Luteimonas sp. e5]